MEKIVSLIVLAGFLSACGVVKTESEPTEFSGTYQAGKVHCQNSATKEWSRSQNLPAGYSKQIVLDGNRSSAQYKETVSFAGCTYTATGTLTNGATLSTLVVSDVTGGACSQSYDIGGIRVSDSFVNGDNINKSLPYNVVSEHPWTSGSKLVCMESFVRTGDAH